MISRCCLIFILLFAAGVQAITAKAGIDSVRLYADYPYINKDEKLLLDVFYTSDSSFKGTLKVEFYKYDTSGDSIRILKKKIERFNFRKGVNRAKLDFSKTDSNTSFLINFYEVLNRTHGLPPGSYKMYLSSKRGCQTVYLHKIDSALNSTSPLRTAINRSLAPKSRSFLSSHSKGKIPNKRSSGGGRALSNKKHKVDKVARRRDLTTKHSQLNDRSYVDFYFEDMFAGRYEIKNDQSLSGQIIDQEDAREKSTDAAVVNNDLDHPSLVSQYKKKSNDRKNQEEVKGEIGLTTNLSSDQEQGSGVANDYVELRGRVEMPIFKIPVELEGLYTTQDNNRKIKSSYFRVHYNVAKMKEELSNSIRSYNSKYPETKSKSTGMKQVYSSAIGSLEAQKARLLDEMAAGKKPTDVDNRKLPDVKNSQAISGRLPRKDSANSDGIYDESETEDSTAVADTSSVSGKKVDRKKLKETAIRDKEKAEQKRSEIEAVDKKITRYKTLLAQNENTNYFDSTLGYAKTKNIGNTDDLSYKQLAKGGANLLPDGRAKSFLAGVTTMDAGMFTKSESKYTMSGQMMKGMDVGYDLGFCEVGATVGKTEYVGRDGSLDKYTFYSGKASFKPAKAQKISLLYYGYSADRKVSMGDIFFKNASISAPAFFQPVHIIATSYVGSVSKFVTVNTEVATSIKQSEKTNLPVSPVSDKMAYHFNAEANIPCTEITLEGTYDKTGRKFENCTLPILLAGTEQHKLAAKNDFLHSFVTVGVDYNRLIQDNFSSRGSNTKWGFAIKTNFKRYPNIALSYKPFTTFRSFTDTFGIPQKPLFGSVWTGKATYQIRRHEKALRFSVLYNKSTTIIDTANYGSTLMQASAMYTSKITTASVTIGVTENTGGMPGLVTAPGKMSFLSLSGSYAFSKVLSVSGGQDFGVASFGFCKYSVNGGMVYRFKKPSISARMSLRYGTYQLLEGAAWKNIYGGCLDVLYNFKTKK